MSYQSLYRTYRPQQFQDVVGQDAIKQALQNAIIKNQKAHAYLFCGPRGTGKTSVAKIFAQAINCQNPQEAPCGVCDVCAHFDVNNHPDIIEIDAASNNGVDEIRDLIEKVKYAPIELTYKVYIIDEVHMLSQGAFNALLKTLEEPPSHVVFILATTEVHKVIPTILSRCQRYDFTRVSTSDIVKRLQFVFDSEEIKVDPDALALIATLADGGMRDALTIAEQVIVFSDDHVSLKSVQQVYKVIGPQEKKDFVEAILLKDLTKVLATLKHFETESIEYRRLVNDLMEFTKESAVYSLTKIEDHVTPLHLKQAIDLSERFSENELLAVVDALIKVSQDSMYNGRYRDYLELAVLKLCVHGPSKTTVAVVKEDVDERLSVKENTDERVVVKDNIEESVVVKDGVDKLLDTKQNDKEEPVEKPQPNITPYNQQAIIEYMVLGDKQLKNHELTLWPEMRNYVSDVRYRKVSPYLAKSTLAISGDGFVVLVVERPEEASHLNNDPSLVSEVITNVLSSHKEALAITLDQFNESVEEFKRLAKLKKLPALETLKQARTQKTEPEIESQPTTEDTINDFFGDVVSIIE